LETNKYHGTMQQTLENIKRETNRTELVSAISCITLYIL
jgi:hypothetical protein